MVMMVNVAIYSAISYQPSAFSKTKKYLAPALCLIIVLIYGYYKLLPTHNSGLATSLKLSVIQGNIPQDLKWDPAAKAYILDKYTRLTEEASQQKPDLIIWPEASDPDTIGQDESGLEKILNLINKTKIPLLIGAVTRDNFDYFNSALLINKQAQVSARYDKLHLVPFGEYIPLKKTFPFLQVIVPIGDITPGRKYTIFQLSAFSFQPSVKFATLICFEDLFPDLSRQFVKRGADFLTVITNDAWYKKTSAAQQHLQASVFRAVENRVYLARAANTGVSAFLAPTGRIISSIKDIAGKEIFVDGQETREIVISKQKESFYTRYGDVFILVLSIFVIFSFLLSVFSSRLKADS